MRLIISGELRKTVRALLRLLYFLIYNTHHVVKKALLQEGGTKIWIIGTISESKETLGIIESNTYI